MLEWEGESTTHRSTGTLSPVPGTGRVDHAAATHYTINIPTPRSQVQEGRTMQGTNPKKQRVALAVMLEWTVKCGGQPGLGNAMGSGGKVRDCPLACALCNRPTYPENRGGRTRPGLTPCPTKERQNEREMHQPVSSHIPSCSRDRSASAIVTYCHPVHSEAIPVGETVPPAQPPPEADQ